MGSVRVLVCGGRAFADEGLFERTMASLPRPVAMICGGARGADAMGSAYALRMGIPVTVYQAAWTQHGRAAGPIRNQQMLDEGKPDLVIAFPGGSGTADMVRRARASGVPVQEVS